ncbi:MAG: hypothetical protein JKY49_02045 [Cohaesibacteraceae bacterium]|nr:hypothetical protein [Cohaesibacteraceae bacterium]
MRWLTLLKGMVGVVLAIANFMERRQLMRAGEAVAIKSALEITNVRVREALEARRASVRQSDDGGVYEDDGKRRD